MEPATTVAGATAGLFLGEFVFKMFEHVCGGMTHHKVSRVIEHAARRFAEGELPPNHDLEGAIHEALGQTARVLAYQLHDPKRGPMRDLLCNLEVGNFLHRLAELAQNNILCGIPRDHWLADLIQEAKDPENFHDFSLKLVLDDHKITRLLENKTDVDLRDHIHDQFLAWVEKHVPDNGQKPSDFADKVRNGWHAGGKEGSKLAFYDIFCLFFREALKDETAVFRAFSASVLTGLQQDIEDIKKSLPDAASLKEFNETLRTFQEKEFDANYSRFKVWTRRQNEKLYASLREEFARVHEKLDVIKDTTEGHRQESRDSFGVLLRYGKWIAAAVFLLLLVFGIFWRQQDTSTKKLEARLVAAQKRDASGSELAEALRRNFEALSFSTQKGDADQRWAMAFEKTARDSGMTADEVRQKMLQNATGAAERRDLARKLGSAAQADAKRLAQTERDADKDLAVAALAEKDEAKALDYFQQALALTSPQNESWEWAALQISIWRTHSYLGLIVDG